MPAAGYVCKGTFRTNALPRLLYVNFTHGRTPDTRYTDICGQGNTDKTVRGDLPNANDESS